MPRSNAVESYSKLFLVSWGTAALISRVVAPMCTPTKRTWKFPAPYDCTSICSLILLIVAILKVILTCSSQMTKNGHLFLNYFIAFHISPSENSVSFHRSWSWGLLEGREEIWMQLERRVENGYDQNILYASMKFSIN